MKRFTLRRSLKPSPTPAWTKVKFTDLCVGAYYAFRPSFEELLYEKMEHQKDYMYLVLQAEETGELIRVTHVFVETENLHRYMTGAK